MPSDLRELFELTEDELEEAMKSLRGAGVLQTIQDIFSGARRVEPGDGVSDESEAEKLAKSAGLDFDGRF